MSSLTSPRKVKGEPHGDPSRPDGAAATMEKRSSPSRSNGNSKKRHEGLEGIEETDASEPGSSKRSPERVEDKPQATEKISCVECRRLKRKCDRIHPCNQCRRYDKVCVFPQPEVPRRGKKYLAEVREKVERLERLLAKHAPHVAIDASLEGESDEPEGDGDDAESATRLMHANSAEMMVGATLSTMAQPGKYTTPVPKMSDERGRPLQPHGIPTPASTSADFGTGLIMQSPAVIPRGISTPVLGPSLSPTSSVGQFDHASSASSTFVYPISSQHSAHHPNPAPRGSLQRNHSHTRRPPSVHSSASYPLPTGPVTSTADQLERQPRDASGYEWNERRIAQANDGTASLSVEPDGEGYLGFASGATLLRILQITAGGISLAHLPPADMEPPAPEQLHPSHHQRCTFINAYFQHYHTQYPILHESTFRAQLAEVIAQPPKAQWEVLSNVVLGLGAFCAGQPMYMIDYFLERAISVISVDHLEAGSLVLVQAFTLLSNLAQKRNKPNAGSTYLGIAVRMAIGLGLHRELPLWNIKPFEREVRRRVWWVVYIFDSGASITFGRPILLPYGEADVKMTHNVQDRDFTPSSPAVPPASRETTVYSSLIYQSSFHLIGNRCYDRVIATPPPTAEEVMELDTDLRDWAQKIPEWMSAASTPAMFEDTPWLYFSAHKLFWRYCNLRIILARRAFLERALKGLPMAASSPGAESDLEHTLASICLQCATDTIYDIHNFFKGRSLNRLETWYGLHFIFQACFVPLIALHTDMTSPDRASWQESVRLACQTLRFVQGDPLADRCARIIDLLMPSIVPEGEIAPSDVNSSGLLDYFQANPMWQGSGDIAQDLLPFADLATLMSFWPASSQQTI